MGCRASKEDVAEPRSKQSHGRDKLHLKDKEALALKPNEITCALDGSECICSLYNHIISPAELNNTSSPPSVFIRTPSDESLSSDEDDDDDEDEDEDDGFDPSSIDIPKKLSVVEEDNDNASQTTALAALSGESKAAVSEKELEERVEAILAAADDGELILPDQSEQCCALGVLSQSAILQALMSTGPVFTQHFLGGDSSSARVGHVAVISGPEPIRWETPLRKAEIIDLDEEQNAGESVMLENTPEHQEKQVSKQEPADDHALTTEEQPQQYSKLQQPEDAHTHKTVLGPEPRKGKLPPLSIVPPILADLPADLFPKPEFPTVVKQALMAAKAPAPAQFEDLSSSDRTPPLALELADSPNESNHEDKRSKSSLVTEHCEDGTPTPVTKSSVDSGWRSPPRDLPDLDIENIVLLSSESPEELDNVQLPLLTMLDCHGIHMDKKDLISPSLRLIS